MKVAAKSHKGMVREINEDCYNVITGMNNEFIALIIADGMGGHNSGEIASKMAVDFISGNIHQCVQGTTQSQSILDNIRDLMDKTNKEVYALSSKEGSNFGMGTTLITAVVFEDKIYIGHIGDSRVYCIRKNKMERITTDHSFIEELVQNGTLSRMEAENHPKKNMITRAIGCTEEVLIDTYVCDIFDEDIFILCTDGLTNMLAENEMIEIVSRETEPEAACEELIKQANINGGRDNITVIVYKK